MKKFLIFILVAVITFFLFAAPAYAFTARGDDEVNITTDMDDDVYTFGGNVNINSDINGDLVVAGGRVTVDGNVSGDLMAAGGYLNVNGDIGDDARIAGGMHTINGKIKDDLIIAGGQIILGSNSEVGGDLIVNGGSLDLDGKIIGDAILSGGSINISGKIDGNVKIESVNELTITGDAEIAGDVVYSSTKKANISDDALIGGKIKATISEKAKEAGIKKGIPVAFFTATYFGSKIISFLSLFALGILLLLLVPKIFTRFNDRMKNTPGNCVGAGAIMVFGVPFVVLILFIISTILFISIIGAGLGTITIFLNLMLIILYILLIYISTIFLSFFIGRMVFYKTSLNMDKYGWKVLAYLVGLIIVMFAYNIPFIGWLCRLAGSLFGFGGLALVIKDWFVSLRKSKP